MSREAVEFDLVWVPKALSERVADRSPDNGLRAPRAKGRTSDGVATGQERGQGFNRWAQATLRCSHRAEESELTRLGVGPGGGRRTKAGRLARVASCLLPTFLLSLFYLRMTKELSTRADLQGIIDDYDCILFE